jgi:hypothetical protein
MVLECVGLVERPSALRKDLAAVGIVFPGLAVTSVRAPLPTRLARIFRETTGSMRHGKISRAES